ncbi:hypothetical protein RRG08_052285 [Elysia crispata]|uniref:Uncharacterized protein n=1 Tax=Elysia crispata TaxID=231223 RepID=A0AAE1DQM1_9GAST|nr:hypothetical protein RRG08_052285 [Elysia crispata]
MDKVIVPDSSGDCQGMAFRLRVQWKKNGCFTQHRTVITNRLVKTQAQSEQQLVGANLVQVCGSCSIHMWLTIK